MNNFWAVWKENGVGASQMRHDSFESAQAEAARLSRQENESYFVLETIGIVRPKEIIPVEYFPINNDDTKES